jgi:hypothetical protein
MQQCHEPCNAEFDPIGGLGSRDSFPLLSGKNNSNRLGQQYGFGDVRTLRLQIRRADGFLFKGGQKLAYLIAAADLVVQHGAQQRGQVYPQRHGDDRSWMVIQRLDEIIDLVDALFKHNRRGSSEAIRHDGSPTGLYAHDNATRSHRQPRTSVFESDFWRKRSEMSETKALADSA